MRRRGRAIALAVVVSSTAGAASAATDALFKGAPTTLETACGNFPNKQLSPYIWWIGSTITWSLTIDLGRPTDVTGGIFTDVVDDDSIELLCDPTTYTLPP